MSHDAHPTGPPADTWSDQDEAAAVLMRVDRPSPGAVVLSVAGEIDNSDAEAVDTAAQELLAASAGADVTIDLSQVQYFGSLGLAVVARAEHTAASIGVRLVGVTGPGNRAVLRPLEIAGLDSLIEWYDTLDEALADRSPDGSNGHSTDGVASRGAVDGTEY